MCCPEVNGIVFTGGSFHACDFVKRGAHIYLPHSPAGYLCILYSLSRTQGWPFTHTESGGGGDGGFGLGAIEVGTRRNLYTGARTKYNYLE